MIGYLTALALAVLAPTSGVQASVVGEVHEHLRGLGVPYRVAAYSLGFAANVVLFIPLTLLGSLLWRRWGPVAWTLAGLGATVTVEAGQTLFLPERTATAQDIVANTMGALFGALLAIPVRQRLRRRYDDRQGAAREEQSPGAAGCLKEPMW